MNLEKEYGLLLDLIEKQLERNIVTHYGVLGMKWGVRKDRAAKRELVGLGPNQISRKTKSGETVTLSRTPPTAIAKFIGRHSSRYTNRYNNSAFMTVTNSQGKKIGDASVIKKSRDELNLVWLGINKAERGKGYATAIMQGAVEFGKQEGFSKLTLEVPGNSPDALHIYEKLGFKAGKSLGDDPVWGGLTEMTYDIDKVKHNTDLETFLSHYGVLGMKWGVRRSPAELARAAGRTVKEHRESSAQAKAATARTRFTSGSKDAPRNLTDEELSDRIRRMETEKRYNELNAKTVSKGQQNVNEVITNVGKKTVQTAASGAIMYVVAKGVKAKFGDEASSFVSRGGAKKGR
jgi:ribosomal protein S18 acetylase RimI-like enzyme